MSFDEALREAREAVLEWRDLREMPRPKALGRGEPVRMVRAELRVGYERRSVEGRSEPAPENARATETVRPDPWSLTLDAPKDGTEWSTRVALEEQASVGPCPICRGARRFRCDDCEGRGYKIERTYDPITGVYITRQFVCGTCAGQKTVRCESCRGTARVRIVPVVVAETAAEVRREVMHDGSVPDELLAEIRAAPSARFWNEKTLHTAEGDDPASGPWGGNRPSALAPKAVAAIEALWNAPSNDDRRKRAWRVEVIEGHVVHFRLPDRSLWVWGSPVRVAGDDEPVGAAAANGLVIAVGVGFAAAVGAAAWWLLR